MKIRSGFVSNSSSSSFVCELCGHTESGWDASLEDCGFVQCVNGHTLCEDEAYEYDEKDADDCIPETSCPICLFEVSSKKDIKKYLAHEYLITESEVFAEVKKANGRRKKLYDVEYVNYVYNKFDIKEAELLSQLKEKFEGSYSKFLNSL